MRNKKDVLDSKIVDKMRELFEYLYADSTDSQYSMPEETLLEMDKNIDNKEHSQSFWLGYWCCVCDYSSFFEDFLEGNYTYFDKLLSESKKKEGSSDVK